MNGDDEPPVDAEWLRVADERESDMARLGSYPISGLLRRARRIAGVSQRELARRVGVSASTVARAESGSIEPTLSVFARMLAVAGLHLVMVDEGGHVVTPMRDIPDTRNGGGWRYPSHLDVILDPKSGEWWGDHYGLARPPETFHRDHDRRRAMQRRTAWEVRAKRNLGEPPPPDPVMDEFLRAQRAARPVQPAPPVDSREFDVDEWTEDDAREWHGRDDHAA